MYAIKAESLTKRYGKLTAVDRLSLEIEEGELFALLGVNGAGKTTTVKMLSQLSTPSEGSITVNGLDAKKHSDRIKRIIGVSPQETAVAPNLTVKENLELICGIYGFSKEKTSEKIRVLSMEAGKNVKVEGKENNLIDLIMQDQDFAVVHDHMEEILDAKKFIGRAPSQTVEFIETEIQPILDRHSTLLGEQGNVQV